MIIELLTEVAGDPQISDLHLTVNSKPVIRRNGDLMAISGEWAVLSSEKLEEIVASLMGANQLSTFKKEREFDFSFSIPGVSRFRVNAYHQRGNIAVAFRIIPSHIKGFKELNLPAVVRDLCKLNSGFVVCTGPTGSGKSTTLAAMVDSINRNRKCHIITLEDPIEYLHHHQESIIHQREIGSDSYSFAKALRVALRQDPDVILVGEMRDLETIATAIEAAETGHLVMTTLHTNDAAQAVERIIDVFPPHQQTQIRIQLAAVFEGVIAHQLIPRRDKQGRVLATEVLVATGAVRNLIREAKTHQLYSVMQTSAQVGMYTMDKSLVTLYERGLISLDDALFRSTDQEYIKKNCAF